MSLFNRKPIVIKEPELDESFKIIQFVKIEGLKKNKQRKYKRQEFISPIFGLTVKDDVVAPYVNKNTGDIAKQYDFMRDHPINDPKTYHEFKGTMVNTETRKELYGDDVYVNTERKYVDPRKKEESIDVPFTGKKEVTFDQVIRPKEEYLKEEIKEEVKKEVPKTPFFETKVEENEKPTPTPKEKISRLEEIKPEIPEVETFSPEPLEVDETRVEPSREVEPTREVFKKKPRRKYLPPTHEMFSKIERDQNARPEWLVRLENTVNETLRHFAVDGKVHNIIKGPTVTRYEIALEPGVNVKKVESIKDNLMMSLAAESLRIEAPIPGKPYVGLELPNEVPEIVAFGNVVEDPEFINSQAPLKIALGVDIDGNNIFYDIKKMPHGLIAGATNSGKSVCVNTIIMSLLMKNHPDDLKFIMIDPKMVELSVYDGIPHLVTPVITEPKMAATALAWATEEMDNRFLRFANARVKDLEGYNEKALTDPSLEKMPYIIIVIDELADLMMVSARDVEDSIQRITQKARAAGIHLLVATQRPTTDVVKGTIKANIPTRIAFKVSQIQDSIVVLDQQGAEQLLGRGDMILKTVGNPLRLQGAYIRDAEIEAVVEFLKAQMEPEYLIDHNQLKDYKEKIELVEDEPLLYPVAQYVVEEQNASINAIQKEFGIGFNRAQKIVELLEKKGVVGASEGTKARQVLVTKAELEDMLS